MQTLADRAAAIAARARQDDTSGLARVKADNVEFVALFGSLKATFDARLGYLQDKTTGREWGKTVEQRVREDGGVGVAVEPAWFPSSGKWYGRKRK